VLAGVNAISTLLAMPLTLEMVGALGAEAPDETGVTYTALEAELVPTLLVAVTVQVYCVLLVRLVTEIGLLVPVPVLVVLPVTHEAV
jgi:hypothetical protein